MHIFVDESGVFAPPEAGSHSVSTIAGIVVPDSALPDLRTQFDQLASQWGMGREVKGRALNEEHFQRVHQLLESHGVFAVLEGIDTGFHLEEVVSQHRKNQASRITRYLGPDTHPNLRRQLQDLARRVDALPSQLYVQMVLLTSLVHSVVQLAVVHFPQTRPAELSRFAWRLDAKGIERTEYEELWRMLVPAFAQSASLRNPYVFLKDVDYSAFQCFQNPDLPAPPPHLRSHVRNTSGVFSTFDVKKVLLDDLDFLDSKQEPGLQLADIVANCFQRACNSRLQPQGWLGLSRLLIRDPTSGEAIHMGQLNTVPAAPQRMASPYRDVVVALNEGAKSPIIETSQL